MDQSDITIDLKSESKDANTVTRKRPKRTDAQIFSAIIRNAERKIRARDAALEKTKNEALSQDKSEV